MRSRLPHLIRAAVILLGLAGFSASAKPVPATAAAPAGPDEGPRPVKAEKRDFLGKGWSAGHDFGHAFNELHALSAAEMRRRGCTAACLKSLDEYEEASGPFVHCTRACLESAYPSEWRNVLRRSLPDSIQSGIKPISYTASTNLDFFPDSAVFEEDTVLEICAAADTAAQVPGEPSPLNYVREYSKKARIVFRDWWVGYDTLHLTRGEKVTSVRYPYRSADRDYADTVPVADRADRFEMSREAYRLHGQSGTRKTLVLPQRIWRERVVIGM